MRAFLALLVLLATAAAADAASLLPPGKNCFMDANGDPLVGGTVQFYQVATTTPKSTWKDSAESILNTNPIILDSAGCSVIYGKGVYRQVIKDQLGNPIWDQQVADPGATGVISVGGPGGGGVGGDGNNVIINGGNSFAGIDGQMISYTATGTNAGPMTITINGVTYPLVKDTVSGPAPMSGGEIRAGNVVNAVYSSIDGRFHLVSVPAATAGPTAVVPVSPGGRLTLRQGNPVMAFNVTTVGVIYYEPFVGSTIPIWTGSLFQPVTFGELAADINATDHLANTIYDLFVINDNGVPRLCTGPAWANSAAGAGDTRTATIGYLFGILVNLAPMNCRWGPGPTLTVSMAAYQATFVGTFLTDTTAGVTSWTPDPVPAASGPSPAQGELYVWNNYNRIAVKSVVFDTTFPSYTDNAGVINTANNSVNNRIVYVSGALTDVVISTYKHRVKVPAVNGDACFYGLGYNSTTAHFQNIYAEVDGEAGGPPITGSDSITNILPAAVGRNFIQALERSSAAGVVCTYLPNGTMQAVLRM